MSSLRKPPYFTESESFLSLDLSLGGLFSRARSVPFDDRQRPSFSLDNLAATCGGHGSEKLIKAFPDRADCMLPQKRRESVSRRRKGFESGGIAQRKRVKESEEPSFTDHRPASSACSFAATSSSCNVCEAHSNLPSLRCDHQKTRESEEEGAGNEQDSMPSTESHLNHPPSDREKPIRSTVGCGWEHSLQIEGVPTAACTSCVHGQASLHLCSTPAGVAPTRETSYCPSTANPASLPSSIVPMLASGSDGLLINDMPREPGRGEELGRSSSSSSIEMERGDGPDNQLIARKKVAELEAPRSRCGSNSDIVGSMGVSAATSSPSSTLHTHPFTIPSVQTLFQAIPVQWCYPLSHPLHYAFQITPPNSGNGSSSLCPTFAAADHLAKNVSLPWTPIISVPEPVLPEASCKPPHKQDTPCEEDAVTSRLALGRQALEKDANLQPLPQAKEVSPTTVHKNLSKTVSDVCTSGAPSPCLLFSTLPLAKDPSDLRTRPIVQPSSSSTSSPVVESNFHVVPKDMQKPRPVNEAPCSDPSSWLTGCSDSKTAAGMSRQRISHTQGDKSKASNSICLQGSDDVCSNLWGQSQHSISSEQKLTKTVRFNCDEREGVKYVSGGKPSKSVRFSSDVKEFVKCSSNEDQLQALSSGMSCCSHSTENKGVEKQPIFSGVRHHNDHGSAITSEISSDQGESADFKAKLAHGKLAGRKLARVSTTCGGPNGKTIQGIMYIKKNKQACLICSCHGTHMSPSEFVQHSGNTDLRNPERNIVITGFFHV